MSGHQSCFCHGPVCMSYHTERVRNGPPHSCCCHWFRMLTRGRFFVCLLDDFLLVFCYYLTFKLIWRTRRPSGQAMATAQVLPLVAHPTAGLFISEGLTFGVSTSHVCFHCLLIFIAFCQLTLSLFLATYVFVYVVVIVVFLVDTSK